MEVFISLAMILLYIVRYFFLSAVIYAFNVDVSPRIVQQAKEAGVSLKRQNVIYRLIDDLKQLISSQLIPKQVEEIIGRCSDILWFCN